MARSLRNKKVRKSKSATRNLQVHSSSEEMKNKILICAKQQFAQFGFQGTNLKDIAKCAGVANSLLNYHFKSKEGLFKACMELFAKSRVDTINRMLLAEPKTREEMQIRIELFVDEMLRSYIDDPDGFDIIQTEIKVDNSIAVDLFSCTFLQSFNNACTFIKNAQKNGLIENQWEPMIIAKLLFTLSCEVVRNDHLGERFFNVTVRDDKWRNKLASHIVHVFMNGVIK